MILSSVIPLIVANSLEIISININFIFFDINALLFIPVIHFLMFLQSYLNLKSETMNLLFLRNYLYTLIFNYFIPENLFQISLSGKVLTEERFLNFNKPSLINFNFNLARLLFYKNHIAESFAILMNQRFFLKKYENKPSYDVLLEDVTLKFTKSLIEEKKFAEALKIIEETTMIIGIKPNIFLIKGEIEINLGSLEEGNKTIQFAEKILLSQDKQYQKINTIYRKNRQHDL
jgi:hypothetical protein